MTKILPKRGDDLKLSNTKQLLWDHHENEKGKTVYPKALYIIQRSNDRSLFFKKMISIRAPSYLELCWPMHSPRKMIDSLA